MTDVKAWLSRYKNALQCVRMYKADVLQLEQIRDEPQALGLPASDCGPAFQAYLEKAREQVKTADRQAGEIRREIEGALTRLSPLQADILRRRYLHLTAQARPQSWEQIADMTHYSREHVGRIHGKALRDLTKIIDSDTPDSGGQ